MDRPPYTCECGLRVPHARPMYCRAYMISLAVAMSRQYTPESLADILTDILTRATGVARDSVSRATESRENG